MNLGLSLHFLFNAEPTSLKLQSPLRHAHSRAYKGMSLFPNTRVPDPAQTILTMYDERLSQHLRFLPFLMIVVMITIPTMFQARRQGHTKEHCGVSRVQGESQIA